MTISSATNSPTTSSPIFIRTASWWANVVTPAELSLWAGPDSAGLQQLRTALRVCVPARVRGRVGDPRRLRHLLHAGNFQCDLCDGGRRAGHGGRSVTGNLTGKPNIFFNDPFSSAVTSGRAELRGQQRPEYARQLHPAVEPEHAAQAAGQLVLDAGYVGSKGTRPYITYGDLNRPLSGGGPDDARACPR